MDERMRFVARLLEGEKMAVLCREFDISRKTGYKLFSRFKNSGIEGLTDRSRRPYRHAISTVHAVLYRNGLVSNGGRKRYKAEGTALSTAARPNDLWCADYKGEFMLADQRYCYPLTITDFTSRYLLCCDALGSTQVTSIQLAK